MLTALLRLDLFCNRVPERGGKIRKENRLLVSLCTGCPAVPSRRPPLARTRPQSQLDQNIPGSLAFCWMAQIQSAVCSLSIAAKFGAWAEPAKDTQWCYLAEVLEEKRARLGGGGSLTWNEASSSSPTYYCRVNKNEAYFSHRFVV